MPDSLYHRKAHGKLLITGEYFVLDGATALALPTTYGQTLKIENSNQFHWRSIDESGSTWLELLEPKMNENQASFKLIELLNLLGEEVWKSSYVMTSDFNREWGLGSSSTLVALLADHFKLNPYELNQKVFRGSGYDIACAFSETPILYSNTDRIHPSIEQVEIPLEIRPHLYFVYLGKKQNSRNAIEHYSNQTIDKKQIGIQLSEISRSLLNTKDFKDWISLLGEHENIISKNLQIEKVANQELKGLPYFSKSLGAWGGDFALIISDDEISSIRKTITNLGFTTLLAYEELF